MDSRGVVLMLVIILPGMRPNAPQLLSGEADLLSVKVELPWQSWDAALLFLGEQASPSPAQEA